MNTISLVVFVIVLSLVQEYFCGFGDDVGDFFKSIPKGIKNAAEKTGDAFSSAWNAIKKPFTVRRLGRGGRRKRRKKTTSTTTTTESFPSDPITGQQLFRRVPLPILPTPQWRGIEHWTLLQLPKYALRQGLAYESRRRQISVWADNYIGPRPTRVSGSSTLPPIRPTNTHAAVTRNPRPWYSVLSKGSDHQDDQYVPIDYYDLSRN